MKQLASCCEPEESASRALRFTCSFTAAEQIPRLRDEDCGRLRHLFCATARDGMSLGQHSASGNQHSDTGEVGCATQSPSEPQNPTGRKIGAENVNVFWVWVCQDVLFSERASVENPIDCRIFFADNPH